MTLTLPIEHGRRYRMRNGEVGFATLSLHCPGVMYIGNCGVTVYKDSGRMTSGRDPAPGDLIEGPLADGHPHAALMAEYAKDAAETAEPWLRWQRTARADCDAGWVDMVCHPGWDADHQYRRKPKTIRIGDRDVPAPLRVPPPVGTTVYVVNLSASDLWSEFAWLEGTDPVQVRLLQRGLLHTSKNDAIAHSNALLQP